jgi:hypothetical protein
MIKNGPDKVNGWWSVTLLYKAGRSIDIIIIDIHYLAFSPDTCLHEIKKKYNKYFEYMSISI